jgi:hypothetical protein
MAFSKFCPSVTLECGQSGESEGIDVAKNYLDSIVNLNGGLGDIDVHKHRVYQTIARLKLDASAQIDFSFNPNASVDLSLLPNIDHLNFIRAEEGTELGYRLSSEIPLRVVDNHGNNVFSDYFEIDAENKIVFKKEVIPSMFTKNLEVAKEDCLAYLMKEIDLNAV